MTSRLPYITITCIVEMSSESRSRTALATTAPVTAGLCAIVPFYELHPFTQLQALIRQYVRHFPRGSDRGIPHSIWYGRGCIRKLVLVSCFPLSHTVRFEQLPCRDRGSVRPILWLLRPGPRKIVESVAAKSTAPKKINSLPNIAYGLHVETDNPEGAGFDCDG